MAELTRPRIPGGMIEWLPGWQRRFNEMLSVIGQTYEMYGFAPISTPALELADRDGVHENIYVGILSQDRYISKASA